MAVQHLEKDILELTKALIHIPSTHSRPEKILACSDFIAQWLVSHDISYTRHLENNVPSIAVMPSATAQTKILLLAHFDVVEVESEAAFSPRVEDGKLYGRGAIDDKYAVALSLILFREHLSALQKRSLTQNEMSQYTDDEHIVLDSLYGLFDSLDSFLIETAQA